MDDPLASLRLKDEKARQPCPEHGLEDRRINCSGCYTDEELQGEIEKLGSYQLPVAPGKNKQPKRTDSEKKKKSSWMDELI